VRDCVRTNVSCFDQYRRRVAARLGPLRFALDLGLVVQDRIQQ